MIRINTRKLILMIIALSIMISITACDHEKKQPTVLQGINIESNNEKELKYDLAQKQSMIETIIKEYGEISGMPLLEIISDDLDNDNLDEHIGIFGTAYKIEALLVMNEEGDEVIPIKWNNTDEHISYDDLKIINMNNSEKKYIQLRISNGFYYSGITLFEVKTTQLVKVLFKMDISGKIGYYMYDEDDDSYYDYALSVRRMNDYQNHVIKTTYKWDGNRFSVGSTVVIYENGLRSFMMPDNPVDVVKNYVDTVNIDRIVSVKDELDLLINADSIIQHDVLALLKDVESKSLLAISSPSKIFDIELINYNENRAIVEIEYMDELIYVSLINKDQWRIINTYKEQQEAYDSHYYLVEEINFENEMTYTLYLNKAINSKDENLYNEIEIYENREDGNIKIFESNNLGINFSGQLISEEEVYVLGNKNEADVNGLIFKVQDEIDKSIKYIIIKYNHGSFEFISIGYLEDMGEEYISYKMKLLEYEADIEQ